ncbi:MAG: hypothetical protein H0V70_16125, partial [Ktedonobacteraceae bacterium]|nr:hypothetical protein [Ktedonobacteraceae bacterium]
TSTRVVERATSLPIEEALREKVQVIFHLDSSNTQLGASIQSWSLSAREDVSVLRVEGPLPKRTRTLPLSLATAQEGRKVSIFGYPTNADTFLGEWKCCDICRPGPKQIKTELPFLQLDSQLIVDGYSGAPVWDDERRKVIGLVTQVVGQNRSGNPRNAYAAPIEFLQRVYTDAQATTPSPYHGLAPFSENDAASFFGYDDVINRMANKLHDEPHFLAVLGPTGSGKSSVVQAGLMPKLRHGEIQGYEEWGIFLTSLSDNPFAQLEAEGLEGATIHLSEGIHTWSQKHNCQHLLFILDQFEIFLHQCPQDIQQRFVEQLRDVIHERAATVILILKDEFYSLLAKHEALMEWVEKSLANVFAPHTKEALLAIAKKRSEIPGSLKDIVSIEQMIENILTQNHASNKSIMGIYELSQTWATLHQEQETQSDENIDTDKLLRTSATTLDDWAETVYNMLDEQQKAFTKHLFTQAILPGDETLGTPDTGRSMQIAALCQYEANYEEAYKTVYDLAERGLLITSRDRVTQHEMVKLANDDLIHEWRRLKEWLREYRTFQLWQQDFQPQVSAWFESPVKNKSDNTSNLLEGFALAEAEMWLTKRPTNFDQQTLGFIQASQQQREPSLYEEAKRQQEEHEQQHHFALARELSNQAISYMQYPTQMQHGIGLAVEALSQIHCPEADQAVRRGLLLLSHPITCITIDDLTANSFSYDGRYAAIAREDLHIDIIELATGQLRFRFPHTAPIIFMTFDATTTYLATVSRDRTVSVWKISEGVRHFSYQEAQRPTMVKFTLDGRYLAVVNRDETNTMINVWEVDPWRHHCKLLENEYVNDIEFNHDNTLLAVVGRNGIIRVWHIASRKDLFVLDAPGPINLVVFSPGGQYLAIGTKQGVVVLDIHSPDPHLPNAVLNERHMASVRSLLFSPQGNYVACGSDDGIARIWDIPSGRKLVQLPHNGSVRAITFSFDSTYIAVAAGDRTVHIWEIGTYQEVTQLIHEQSVQKVVFSMDRRYLFTLSDDRTIRVWEIIKSRQCTTVVCRSPITAVTCSVHDEILYLTACCMDNTLWQWQIDHRNERRDIPCISQISVCSLASSSDGRYIVTASTTGDIRLWDSVQAQEKVSFSCEKTVVKVSFCRDNRYVAIMSQNGTIQLWEWETKSIYSTLKLNIEQPVNDITLSPDEHFIGTIEIFGSARIWEWRVSGADLLFELPHTSAVLGIRFSPAGQTIATISSDYTAYLWDMSDGSCLFPLEHNNKISEITFSPDGRHIATASADHHIKVWETATGRLLSDLPQRTGVRTVTFSPDGIYLVTGSDDGIVCVWLWQPEDLIYEVFTHSTLIEEEWQQAGENEPDPTACPHAL